MPLDDLVKTIEELKERIAQHRPMLRQSEASTRYILIDPLLRKLGWDTEDANKVRPEFTGIGGGRADYALFGSIAQDKPAAMLEAKPLGTTITTAVVDQAFRYCYPEGINYMIISNGDNWRLYDLHTGGLALNEREVESFSLSINDDDAFRCALKLMMIWRTNLESGIAVPAGEPLLTPGVDAQEGFQFENLGPAGTVGPEMANWIPLDELRSVVSRQPPSRIRFSNGEEREIRRWWHVLFETAESLVRSGLLTRDVCPIRHGRTRYLVHNLPQHSNGTPFNNHRTLSNGLFLDSPYDANGLLNGARFLIERFGQDPSSVSIHD